MIHPPPRFSDFGTIWHWLANRHFQTQIVGHSLSHPERGALFRRCIEHAFYNLSSMLCGKSVQVTDRDRPSRTVSLKKSDLQCLMPALAHTKGLAPGLTAELGSVLSGMSPIAPEEIGYAFEHLYGQVPDGESGFGTRASRERNIRGVFYTPTPLVEELCEAALTPLLVECPTREAVAELAILDPAMGGGRFLLEASNQLAARMQSLGCLADDAHRIALGVLYGVDRDHLAVDVARISLWLAGGATAELALSLRKHLRHGDALTGPVETRRSKLESAPETNEDINWPSSFPEIFERKRPGFDLVLGNPPWGKVKSEYKRFLSAFLDEVSGLQGAELRRHISSHSQDSVQGQSASDWENHAADVNAYSQRLKARFGPAEGIEGRGDADLYKYFMARGFQLARDRGTVALIVPAAFRNTEGSGSLRSRYLDGGRFLLFTERTNADRHFPIHSMFRFISFVFSKGTAGGIENMTFVHGRKTSEIVKLDRNELVAIGGPELLIPEVRSQRDAELLKRLYNRFEPLGAAGPWSVRFVREVDMTNASERFITLDSRVSNNGRATLFPVYEGRMVGQFDYAAKAYISGGGRTAEWRHLPMGQKRISPHYYLPVVATDRKIHGYRQPRAAFCDITGHANRRTVLASIVPPDVVCGNKVPTCRFEPYDDPRLHLLWVALANSLTVDWLVRRRISTTLNFFHWYAIPFPRLSPEDDVAKRLIARTAALVNIEHDNTVMRAWLQEACGHSGDVIVDLQERQSIVNDIDNDVFNIYGIDHYERNIIRSDFKYLSAQAEDNQRTCLRERPSNYRREAA